MKNNYDIYLVLRDTPPAERAAVYSELAKKATFKVKSLEFIMKQGDILHARN